MEQRALERKIAHLEFVNEQLGAELNYVDHLLKIIGFPEGLITIKEAACEVIEDEEFDLDP